jgi:hypothetical protein
MTYAKPMTVMMYNAIVKAIYTDAVLPIMDESAKIGHFNKNVCAAGKIASLNVSASPNM